MEGGEDAAFIPSGVFAQPLTLQGSPFSGRQALTALLLWIRVLTTRGCRYDQREGDALRLAFSAPLQAPVE